MMKEINISSVKKLTKDQLKKINMETVITNKGKERLAVLIPYNLYMKIQNQLMRHEKDIRELQAKIDWGW